MLNFILGIAGTGKTTKLFEQIKKRADSGLPSVLLVPEQSSSSAEGMVYSMFGEEQNGLVAVLSFRTLAERILKEQGGISRKIVSDAARVVFVRRALDALGDELKSFSRHRRNTAFCAMCAHTISELKTAGATSETLRLTAKETENDKMAELALLLDAYSASIQNVALDPEDRLEIAANQLQNSSFCHSAVFIDDFDGFTAPEYILLEKLIACCPDVTLTLCCDDTQEKDDGLGLFSPVRKTANRLMEKAKKNGIKTKSSDILSLVKRGQGTGLDDINLMLAFKEAMDCDTSSITLTEYADEWQEARAVCAKMRALAIGGVQYAKMAVVCRDLAAYRPSMHRAFEMFSIPYFCDANDTIEYTAPVAFVRSALRVLAEGITTEPILALLKTGLCGFDEEQLFALENYAYTWSPKSADWRGGLSQNPNGLLAEMTTSAEKELENLEELRAKIIPPLENFVKRCKGGNVGEVSRQIYLLMKDFGAGENSDNAISQLAFGGEHALAEASRRAWDVCMELLDEMVLLMEKDTLPPTEYDDLFLLLVRATEFGKTPPSLECATLTSADRMRLHDTDYVFLVGVLEGEFPMQVGYSGLLTHTDREALVASGVQMPGSFENRTLLEEMFFYRALTTASKKMHISHPAWRGGEAKFRSSSLEPLGKAKPAPLLLDIVQQAATPASAFALLAEEKYSKNSRSAVLFSALEQSGNSFLPLLDTIQPSASHKMQDKNLVRQLVGSEITLSPTRIEQYNSCAFSYFLDRVTKIKPRRKAELSPLESGSFVHYVLENVLRELGDGFASAADPVILESSNKHAQFYIDKNLPLSSQRDTNTLARIKETTSQLLFFLRDDAAQNAFVVDTLELAIGGQTPDIPAYRLETPDGNSINIVGKIDRVDTLTINGKTYLRILDYKTGQKKFALDDVFCGLNMQMLVYMAALKNSDDARYKNALPAGVLYLLSDPPPTSGNRNDNPDPLFVYDGLLLQDKTILKAMDKNADPKGVFLPVSYLKSGEPRKSKMLANLEKFGAIEKHIQSMLRQMADSVYNGQFDASPLVKAQQTPCAYCPYRVVCRHENGKDERLIEAPKNVFETAEEEQ